jgi:hypothetical protein
MRHICMTQCEKTGRWYCSEYFDQINDVIVGCGLSKEQAYSSMQTQIQYAQQLFII